MTAVAAGVASLYSAYKALPEQEQAQFIQLLSKKLKVAGATVPVTVTEQQARDIDLLYSTVRERLLSYQGYSLPPLGVLNKTAAKEELRAVWEWLTDGKPVSTPALRAGLVEIAAEAVARQVLWRKDAAYTLERVCELIRAIPRSVDRSFPGYKINRTLRLIAEDIGKGALPVINTASDEDTN